MGNKILLVDDEEDFLDVLGEFLTEQGYKVTCASNAMQALGILALEHFDLLLSDINMPGMKGFELLQQTARTYPQVKRALITAYDVRDYFTLARKHDVGNIITKTTPFNFDETATLIRNILTEEVFGLGRYVSCEPQQRMITGTNQVDDVVDTVICAMPDESRQRRFRHGLGELIINAIYYGARDEKGDRKQEWSTEVEIAAADAIAVGWGVDGEKAAVSVTDRKGRLTKQDVLYWLERNTIRGAAGLPEGFYDVHGKGLFITRELNDRLIINIKKGVCTEIILINYGEGKYDGHRPLWIHEF